jgi:hypothetical protein
MSDFTTGRLLRNSGRSTVLAMPGHYDYVVVTCKTPACGRVSAVKYLGIHTLEPDLETVTEKFLYECRTCHRSYLYTLSEIRIQSYSFPPPPGWESQF